MNQKSQAEDLGVPSELMGYGIGFMIMAITMVLAIIINIVASVSNGSSAKAIK